MNIISSKNNDKIKILKKIRDDSFFRKENKLCFLEGERLIIDTPINYIKEIYINENYNGKLPNSFGKNKIIILKDDVYKLVSDTINSKGIIAIATHFDIDFFSLLNTTRQFFVILNGIKDPGNMGTIIRTSEAAGVSGIIVDGNCCDIYSPKVIRASMSSIFRVKIYKTPNLIDTITALQKNNVKIYSTSLKAKNDYTQIDYEKKLALVIGSESNGIDEEIVEMSNEKIIIKMEGQIESLNAAIATSIILFEIKRKLSEG